MFFMPWLYQEISQNIAHREEMERVTDKLFTHTIDYLIEDHSVYLKREEDRIQQIVDQEIEDKRQFDEARKIRRDIRA